MPILPRIPFMAEAEKSQPLMVAIRHASVEMGLSDFVTAQVMSHILEKIAEQVAAGTQVYIPGFGMFSPTVHGKTKKRGGGYAYPAFSPSRAFRAEVRAVCSGAKARKGYEIIGKHYKHHHASARAADSQRVFTAMAAFREHVQADARRMGIDE